MSRQAAVERSSTAASPSIAESVYASRGRLFNTKNAFNIKLPPVPCHQFLAERDAAFSADSPTGLIPLDLSERLGMSFPATTPLVLSRYVRIRDGESIATTFKASGEIYYAIVGKGESVNGDDTIGWEAGDVFCFPGGSETRHRALAGDCVLWVVTNEPQLALERAEPPALGNAPVEAVHFPAAAIRAELDHVNSLPREDDTSGLAVIFSSAALEHLRNIMPSITLAMNSLPPGEGQRPHRHNSAALTLCVQGEGCYSWIEGQRVDWQQHAVMVTPPADAHSHHNEGTEQMMSLVVQDGGLYYHCRTMGFSFEDTAAQATR